ncbi:uncharacterized protein LOC131929753 [Physella acuta]|uniref:uncharacterized protein LOC131929753 n=1 Tax=Physella acuta TaxID=109671 RepID=UPI0027DC3853|nr:uncharacterized protein LOC131929753 [Physella acuta]
MLIRNGTNVNEATFEGNTALMYSCDNFALKQNLVKHINTYKPDVTVFRIDEWKATKYETNNITCNNNVNTKAEVIIGQEKAAELLIKSGADINIVNKNGWSALMYAARSGAKETVELLMESGCDVLAVNKEGDNALAIASKYGNEEIVQYLSPWYKTICIDGQQRGVPFVKPQPSTVDDMMKDDMVKQVLDLDIPEDLVKKTLQKRLEDKGTQFASAEALTEAVLEDNLLSLSTTTPDDPSISTQEKKATGLKELLVCKTCCEEDVDTKFEPCCHLSCGNCCFHVHICPTCGLPIQTKINPPYIAILAVILTCLIEEKVKAEKINISPSTIPECTLKDQQGPMHGKLQEKHFKILRRKYKYLVEEIDGKFLTDHLFTEGIITFDDKQEVMAIQTRSGRTRALLDKILNAGPGRAFPEFINSLKEHYPHIAEELYNKL